MQQCRADGLIDPDAIPGTNIQPAVVDEASTAFTKSGTAVADGGTDVKAKWGGLAGSYETPDSAQLLSVMDSVVTDTASLSTTMASVAKAVSTYASAIEPVVAELKKIQGEARTFVAKALKGKTVGPWDPDHPVNRGLVELVQNFGQVLDDVHIPWDQYQPYIKENNDLLTRVAEQETKLSTASADCVNAINGLRTDMCIAPVSGVDYAGAVKANQPMVWGATGRGDQSCGQKFGSGIEDAAKGTVEGLGGLVSYNAQTGKWGDWDWAGKSWLGFAESLGAIVLIGSPPLLLAAYLPKGIVPDEVRNTALNIVDKQKQIVEGFVGTPEDWANDPAHAAGGLTFNVGTLFIPGAGEVGAGAKVASIAAKVGTIGADGSKLAAVTAKVAAVGTTVVRVGDALSAMRAGVRGAVDDAMSAVRSDLAKSLHSLADRIPGINVAVERAAMPGGMDIGLGHPRIEVEPGGGGQWLHSVADHVGGPSHHGGAGDLGSSAHEPGGLGEHPEVDDPAATAVREHAQGSVAPPDAPPRDGEFARAPDDQPVIGHEELRGDSAYAKWELIKRNPPGMAEQGYFTGIHQPGDGTVPELVAHLDNGKTVSFDGFRVIDDENVFTDTKGNHSIWYKFSNWTPEQLRAKDDVEIQKTVNQIGRQVEAIQSLGGGRLEFIVTDRRFASLLENEVDTVSSRWDVDVDVIYKQMG